MAQFRPRKRSTPLRTSEVTRTTTDETVEVAASAIRDMAQWNAARTLAASDAPVSEMLQRLPYKDIRRAAVHAGRTEPSDRTIRRWRLNNRIPDPNTAALIARRDLIHRIGGTARASQLLGRSRSALNAWLAGRTKSLRPDAQIRLASVRAALRLTASGIDPTTQTPYITFTADVMVRNGSEDHYDYRHRKDFVLGNPPPGSGLRGGQDIAKGNQMPQQTVIDFAMAMAADNYALMVAILEDYVSTNVADFTDYDNATGFHFEHVAALRVLWR